MKKNCMHSNKNEGLTYDITDNGLSNFELEYGSNIQICENKDSNIINNEIRYSKQEIENLLKDFFKNVVYELEKVIDEKYEKYNLITEYNKNIENWNEVLCSVKYNDKFVNLKISNDYLCNNQNSISSIYITLFSNNGKCVFTECIQRVKQEYEFVGHNYSHVPINESELHFKVLDKNKIIECMLSEIKKII